MWRDTFYARWIRVRDRCIKEIFSNATNQWWDLYDPKTKFCPNPLWYWKSYTLFHEDSTPYHGTFIRTPIFEAPCVDDFSYPINLQQVNAKLLVFKELSDLVEKHQLERPGTERPTKRRRISECNKEETL